MEDVLATGLKIGAGTYGDIYVIPNAPLRVAKVITAGAFDMTEVDHLRSINHPNVIRLLAHYPINRHRRHMLIFPRFERSVFSAVNSGLFVGQPVSQRLAVRQLLMGLRAMHKARIIHGDLTSGNVLVTFNPFHVAICDLGNSLRITPGKVGCYYCTEWYRAPEIIVQSEDPYSPRVPQVLTFKTDAYSAGCVAAEIVTGVPMKSRTIPTVDCNDPLYGVVHGLTLVDRTKRLTPFSALRRYI